MSRPSIALDLGTANTRIYASQCGEVTEIPSSISLAGNKTSDISDEYMRYTNNKLAFKPLRGGVIVDLKNAVTLLRPLIKKSRKFLSAPASLASAPTDSTENERELLRNALLNAGASHVTIIPEVWAAAIGAGIDITLPTAQLLIDIGDGVTDMAVFCDGHMICCSSVRIACSDIQRAVRSAVMAKYKIQVYDHDVQRLTHELSSILDDRDDRHESIELVGIDIVKRRNVKCLVDKNVVIEAIEPVIDKMIRMIETSLKKLPEKVYCSIIESGICLTGGGACIEGMDRLIAFRTSMDVRIAPDPMHAVINGEIKTLEYWKEKKCWWEIITWPHNPLPA